jgi:hypothetical protein
MPSISRASPAAAWVSRFAPVFGRVGVPLVELAWLALPERGWVASGVAPDPLGGAALFDPDAPDVLEPAELVASTVTVPFMNGCVEQK